MPIVGRMVLLGSGLIGGGGEKNWHTIGEVESTDPLDLEAVRFAQGTQIFSSSLQDFLLNRTEFLARD